MKRCRPIKPFRGAIWNGERWEGKPIWVKETFAHLKRCAKRKKPIASSGAKRKCQLNVYGKQRKKYLAAHPVCEICLPLCSITATDVHHKKRRRGEMLLKEEFWVAACRRCHVWLHQNPQRARELGWLDSAQKIN